MMGGERFSSPVGACISYRNISTGLLKLQNWFIKKVIELLFLSGLPCPFDEWPSGG
jgi:hypothetical protein